MASVKCFRCLTSLIKHQNNSVRIVLSFDIQSKRFINLKQRSNPYNVKQITQRKIIENSDDDTRNLQHKEFQVASEIIDEFQTALQIYNFITTSVPSNTQLWGQAIAKCIKLNDIEYAINIIDIMYQQNIERTVITYNILFNGFIKSSKYGINECFNYLDKMIVQDLIEFNPIICSTLARGVRTEDNIDVNKVQKIEKLVNDFNISPDILCYSELIRIQVRCYELIRGYKYWKQMFSEFKNYLKDPKTNYLTKSENKLINLEQRPYWKPFVSATTDLINGFASNGSNHNVRRMIKIWKLLQKDLNFYGDRIIYGCLMKGLLNNNYRNNNDDINYLYQILKLWKEMVVIKNINPDYKNYHCISQCYLRIIEHIINNNDYNDIDNDKELKLQIKLCLTKLMHDIPVERKKYGLKENDHILARYQLQANVLIWYKTKPNIILKLFNSLKNDNKIGISIMQQSNDTIMCDLNDCMYQQEMEFMLKYLFNYHTDMIKDKNLLIMIGKINEEETQLNNKHFHQQKVEKAMKLCEYMYNIINEWNCDVNLIKLNDNMLKFEVEDVNKINNLTQINIC